MFAVLTDTVIDVIENCLYILWKHLEFYLLSVGAQLSSRQVVRQYMRNLKGNGVNYVIVNTCYM